MMCVFFLSLGERAQAQPVTIVALGDSLVRGYGLPVDQGFVAQLQNWLTDNGADVVVLNAGVSGDTTTGGLARAAWTMTPDVDAVIVSLGGNDVLRGIDPALARANLTAILELARAKSLPVLLVGVSAPSNYGADYKREFDATYPTLATEFGTLIYPNFLKALAEMPNRQATLSDYFQPDGLHPNAKGVAEIVNDMGPFVVELVVEAAKE